MSSYTKAYGRVLIHYLTSRIHFESSRVNNWLLELIMFAARFDPTKVVREEPKIIPQKRAIPDDVESSDSDQDIDDGVEVGAVSKEQSGTDVTTTRAVDGKSESDSESESESESDSDDEMNFDMEVALHPLMMMKCPARMQMWMMMASTPRCYPGSRRHCPYKIKYQHWKRLIHRIYQKMEKHMT